MSEQAVGYATVTYKVRLYDRHHDWLAETKDLYNRVVWHYYERLMKEPQFLELSNFLLLRKVEELSIGTRESKKRNEIPLWSLDGFPKIPLYFRRAAINTAIGLARSYQGLQSLWNENLSVGKPPSEASAVQGAPVFYKGMYRDFGNGSITLKLFTGSEWKWVPYRYVGREFPEDGKQLSPVLKVGKKDAWLHIPVVIQVQDIRTIRERMKTESQILAVYFPKEDCMAVCLVLDRNGKCLDSRWFRGGAEREEKLSKQRRRLVKAKQDKSSELSAICRKITNINSHYAHVISTQILNYCKQKQVSVIAVPDFEREGANNFPMAIEDGSSWIGRRILSYLKYKAFREGILVGTVRPYHIMEYCSKCGAPLRKNPKGMFPEKGTCSEKRYLCENGHQGNYDWNIARNIGMYFLEFYI